MQPIRFIDNKIPKLIREDGALCIGFPKNRNDYNFFNYNSHLRCILETLSRRKLTFLEQDITRIDLHLTLLNDSICQLLVKIIKRFAWITCFGFSLCGRTFTHTQETSRFLAAIQSHDKITSFVLADFKGNHEMHSILAPFEGNKKIQHLVIQNGDLDYSTHYPHIISQIITSCRKLETFIVDCQLSNCTFYDGSQSYYPDKEKIIKALEKNKTLIDIELPLLCDIPKSIIDSVTARNKASRFFKDLPEEIYPFSHLLLETVQHVSSSGKEKQRKNTSSFSKKEINRQSR